VLPPPADVSGVNALFFTRFGGPEVLEYGELPEPQPRAGHAIVRTTAIGLNFADVYRRRGNYHLAGSAPYIAGYEASGTIASLPENAPAELRTGMRVAFADSPFANAELVSAPYSKLIPLPEGVDDETAAAVLLQGLTAQFLTSEGYEPRTRDRIVVHAAAGGVGLLLVQMLRAKGAHVIAFASTPEKCAAAQSAGAAEAHTYEGWPHAAAGVDAVYDSIGTTLTESIAAVRIGGTVVFYGFSGGEPPAIDARALMDGSKRVAGGDLWNVLTSHEQRVTRANELFAMLRSGAVRPLIARKFALREGAAAHDFLESRAAIGKVLLIP
jgi:NADPH2:quinone reductase